MTEREEKFEKMLKAILDQYDDVVLKMEKLKNEDKTKTVSYKQLMATKLTLGNMLSMYFLRMIMCYFSINMKEYQ